MNAVTTIWHVLQLVVGYNLVLPLILAAFYLIARTFCKVTRMERQDDAADYAVIVTAYQQTAQLPLVVASLLAQDYDNYTIYIVADGCDVSELHFDPDRVVLLRPETLLSSNTGSHFYAIDRFIRLHGRLTIIDSDNIVQPGYFHALNRAFDAGYGAVQGVREAKNLDSMYACLDAARDKYYHFYDGEVLFRSGASATLAGSGMAFTTSLYRECLEHLDIRGAGFDKVLQYEIVKRGHRIAFAAGARVLDEKTSKPDELVNQRARWIQSWFRYFGFGFNLIGKGILRLNWNQALFGLVLLRPPLFVFLLSGVLALVVNLAIEPAAAIAWATALVLFVVGFMVALQAQRTDPRIYRSLAGIPRFIFLQLKSLARARHAGKYSVATRHPAGSSTPIIPDEAGI
jgi:cellulose synthase/poly-beta-1,6-N-acetylglucosamine synthase-like glycosyltransferase